MTIKHTFPGGEKVLILHRFALRLEEGQRFVEIGFEQAFEPGIERLIHKNSIQIWKTASGNVQITAAEKIIILERVIEYCKIKNLTYRVV